ncbi:MAG: ABC transporter permease subunit [Chloroflexi bacterium]|jgi:peptide/nickel transport system permease protein|nr:ABC transporter permease subunit [Chloroflexota bacterium]
MWKFLGKRLLQMMLTLLLFQAATYFLIDAQPGDIADLLAMDPNIPPQERQRLRAELGLDRPPVERFFTYIGNFYTGNLGVSFQEYPKPVTDIIKERLPRTLVLFLSSTLVSFWAGFLTGKVLAWRRGGLIEYASTITGVTLYTVFTPWFALMMIWLFAVQLDWLPAGKFLDPVEWLNAPMTSNQIFMRMIMTGIAVIAVTFLGFWYSNRIPRKQRVWFRLASFFVPLAIALVIWISSGLAPLGWDILSHLILPVLTVTLVAYAGNMLLTRTSMLETLREDYILTARAKGLSEKVVRDKHAARNALLPVWTGLVFSLGRSVSGGIITETVFSWPGIGLTLLQASQVADIPVAMGVFTIVAVMTLTSHLIADIGYALLDPRIRYS